MDTYVLHRHNIIAWYIATRLLLGMFLAAYRQPVMRVVRRWWDQEGIDLEGARAEAEVELEEEADSETEEPYMGGRGGVNGYQRWDIDSDGSK